jgi:Acyl-CoA carboxylase epsilon subunit
VSGTNSTDAVSELAQDPQDPQEPLFRVVRGAPTDVELAALSVVLAARMRPAEEPTAPPQGPTAWAASGRTGRRLGRPGPDAWRRSARP